jgi:hypothetical protein
MPLLCMIAVLDWSERLVYSVAGATTRIWWWPELAFVAGRAPSKVRSADEVYQPSMRNRKPMPKLPPLPPEFRAIRDNPDLTEEEKIDAVWELLAQRGTPFIRPLGTPEDEFYLGEHRERTFYCAERGKNGKLQMIAIDPEMCRLIIRHVFLHPDED